MENIWFWGNKLRTTGSLLHVKSPGKTQSSEENVNRKTMTGHSYLDMLELYALPQLPPQTIVPQDGALPHFCHHVRNHLDIDGWEMDQQRWTNRLAS
jgi:hypothetical protein